VKRVKYLKKAVKMKSFEEKIFDRVKKIKKKIVFVDWLDERLYEGLEEFKKLDQNIIIIGNIAEVREKLKKHNLHKYSELEVIDPKNSKKLNLYSEYLIDLRKKDKLDLKAAKKMLLSPLYYGALMIKIGDADCGIGGASYSSSEFLSAAIKIIGKRKDLSVVSGAMVEILPNFHNGSEGQFILADVAIVPDPDEEELTDIILATDETATLLFEKRPNIAILYYSTKGSTYSRSMERIADVIGRVRKRRPDIKLEGELQLDAAIVPEVAKIKAPESKIAGKANALIFPNLPSANICCKAIERFAKANAYGSINQGLLKPYNDLSRGCSSRDVSVMSAITVLQSSQIN
jgi:phosphate acetyltransferase